MSQEYIFPPLCPDCKSEHYYANLVNGEIVLTCQECDKSEKDYIFCPASTCLDKDVPW